MTITYTVRIKRRPEYDSTLIDSAEAAVRLTEACGIAKHAEAVALLMQMAGLDQTNVMCAFERWIGENQTAEQAHQLLRDLWDEAPQWLKQAMTAKDTP